MRHRKHYTVQEARALLPQVRKWLERIDNLRQELVSLETKLTSLAADGADLGGPMVNRRLVIWVELQACFREFSTREIQVKDLERGLIDFPALFGTREVYLCWQRGENSIEFWHELDSGYSGRAPLEQ